MSIGAKRRGGRCPTTRAWDVVEGGFRVAAWEIGGDRGVAHVAEQEWPCGRCGRRAPF